MSGFRIGVDAGGSRAEVVVADPSGQERARVSGPCRVLEPGAVGAAVDALAGLILRALREAGEGHAADTLRVGWAGAGREVVRREAEEGLRAAGLAAEVHLRTDVDLTFESVFGDGPGILVVAGTGSVALGRGAVARPSSGDLPSARSQPEGSAVAPPRSPAAPFVRVGGWGSRLGDEGSGYWIAMQALGCVARAEDGRAQRTALRAAVLERLGLADPYDLIGWVAAAGKRDVAALAPAVLDVAAAGDPVAASIATDAAAALRSHVVALLDRLDMESPPPLALWGGLIAEGGPLRDVLEHLLHPLGLEIRRERIDPAGTAAGVARHIDRPGPATASN